MPFSLRASALPSATLDGFLNEEVGPGSCARSLEADPSVEGEEEEGDEYGDINWYDGEVDALEIDRAGARANSANGSFAIEPISTRASDDSAHHVTEVPAVVEVVSTANEPQASNEERPNAQESNCRRRELQRWSAERHLALSLCFVARLQALNSVCEDELVQAVSLSLVPMPSAACETIGDGFVAVLSRLLSPKRGPAAPSDRRRLAIVGALLGQTHASEEDLAVMVVARCRAERIQARLAMLVPLPSAAGCGALVGRGVKGDSISSLPSAPVWAEVYDERLSRWCPLLAGLTASEVRRLARAPWVLAIGEKPTQRLYDVTRRYSDRCSTTIASRGSLGRHWDAMVANFGDNDDGSMADMAPTETETAAANRALCADLADERELTKRVLKEPMPSSKAGFKRHPTYVLESLIRQVEVVHPAGTKPVGLFRGKEPIWRRSDVKELKTCAQWRREGRQVRDDERPVKILRGPMESRLFGFWQTAPGPKGVSDASGAVLVDSGPIPGVNNYGNFELLDPLRDKLPQGLVHCADDLAQKVAARIGLCFAPVVVGFTSERGRPKPQYGGVAIWKRDEVALTGAVAQERKKLEEQLLEQRAERFRSTWRLLAKTILLERYVESRHRGSS